MNTGTDRTNPTISLLVVEDNEIDRELYQRLLARDRKSRYEFFETASKSTAVEMFESLQPDCLILDFKLPGYTGIELLKEIRNRNPGRSIPAILLTGGGTEAIAAEAIKHGAKEYLSKQALGPESLSLAIRAAITKTEADEELGRRQGEIEEALNLARKASVAKSEFLANMSHEIRTPLNGVLGFIDLVLEDPLPPKQREYLDVAKSSAQHLLSLINDILDLSKIEAGQLRFESISFNLSELIRDAVNICHPQILGKQHELVLRIQDDVPVWILGDPVRLRQILVNLLSNAVKFTPDGGGILLHCKSQILDDGCIQLHFSVADSGVGIPQERQTEIFKPFVQADASTTRHYGGTGLGLSIASRLVEMYGGRIWVESRQAIGTAFHFTISVKEVTPDSGMAKSEESGGENLRALNILVAEDNAVNAKLIAVLLKKAGHQVTIAPDGLAAISLFSNAKYDLVFMDLQMPNLDGVGATERIRLLERDLGGRVPIVALTASALDHERARCAEIGMDGYLAKPVNKAELMDVLRIVAKSSRVSVST